MRHFATESGKSKGQFYTPAEVHPCSLGGGGVTSVRAGNRHPDHSRHGQLDLGMTKRYGFKPSFNQTYEVPGSATGWWVTPYHFGLIRARWF